MIPVEREDVFSSALLLLRRYGEKTSIRGRFVLVYLGLRKMRGSLEELGSTASTPTREIEEYLDQLYTKTTQPSPLTVLTSPFGQSTSPHAPWSTRTGDIAPGNKHPTNTWRNNLNVQKGIGCPAEPETIRTMLTNPLVRLHCPWMETDAEGRQRCGLTMTNYRGDEHSIWLRMTQDGNQVVDLDLPAVYGSYLAPEGRKIPIFALIPVLYYAAPLGIYPNRHKVGVPEFCEDFGFEVDNAIEMFDCDPDGPENSEIVIMASGGPLEASPAGEVAAASHERQPLPEVLDPGTLNTGIGAEVAVAKDLQRYGWSVSYTGNVRGIGHDLLAIQNGNTLRVEVKSSVSRCTPTLTEEEWRAAERNGDEYVLAVVDFYGSLGQEITYVRNPVANVNPAARQVMTYRVARQDVTSLGVGAEFL